MLIAMHACTVGCHYTCMFFRPFTEKIFAVVSWPEEDNDVSVISSVRHHVNGPFMVGKVCKVIYGKKTFPPGFRQQVCACRCLNLDLHAYCADFCLACMCIHVLWIMLFMFCGVCVCCKKTCI